MRFFAWPREGFTENQTLGSARLIPSGFGGLCGFTRMIRAYPHNPPNPLGIPIAPASDSISVHQRAAAQASA